MKRCVLLLGVVIALVALETSASAQAVVIPGVPRLRWYGGCSPTAAGMILGYWDLYPDGYWSDLIAGVISNYGDATIGSQGYYDDYWTGPDLWDPGQPPVYPSNDPALDPDPMGANHTNDSIADFLGTSRSWDDPVTPWHDGLADGDTRRREIASGLMDYANSQSYDAASWLADVAQYDPPGGAAPLTWEAYKAEIDQGYPVLISVRNFLEKDPQNLSRIIIQGHSVVGYGYQDDMFHVKYFIGPADDPNTPSIDESQDPNLANEDDPLQWTTATVGGYAVMDTWAPGISGSNWMGWDGTSEVTIDPYIDTEGREWWPWIDLTDTNGWLYDSPLAHWSWSVRGAVYFHPLAHH